MDLSRCLGCGNPNPLIMGHDFLKGAFCERCQYQEDTPELELLELEDTEQADDPKGEEVLSPGRGLLGRKACPRCGNPEPAWLRHQFIGGYSCNKCKRSYDEQQRYRRGGIQIRGL